MNRSDKINEQNQTILELENEKKNLYNQLEGKKSKNYIIKKYNRSNQYENSFS